MSAEADQLRADIATAEHRLAAHEAQACRLPAAQRSAVEHQIKNAKQGLRDMCINLAAIEDRTDICPVCAGTTPPGWLVCEPCAREVPAKLHTAWQCASHFTHATRASKKSPALIAQAEGTERQTRQAIINHLKQHGSAIL